MCPPDAPKIPLAPPPAAPPAVLEQLAPKSASTSTVQADKRRGLSRYKINTSQSSSVQTPIGGIPTKVGV